MEVIYLSISDRTGPVRMAAGMLYLGNAAGVRYFLLWYDMAWYGMVWQDMVWFGLVWYGLVWYGLVWFGLA